MVVFAVLISLSQIPMDWLSGCWRWEKGSMVGIEQWGPAHGGIMMGSGVVMRDGIAIEFEHLRIDLRADHPVYVAIPSGQAMTEFALAESSANSLVFTNEAHDFPKRITYTLLDDGRLRARVDDGSDARSLVFEFESVACD